MSSKKPKKLPCLWTCCLGNTAPLLQHPKMSWATQTQEPWLYRWEIHLLREHFWAQEDGKSSPGGNQRWKILHGTDVLDPTERELSDECIFNNTNRYLFTCKYSANHCKIGIHSHASSLQIVDQILCLYWLI